MPRITGKTKDRQILHAQKDKPILDTTPRVVSSEKLN